MQDIEEIAQGLHEGAVQVLETAINQERHCACTECAANLVMHFLWPRIARVTLNDLADTLVRSGADATLTHGQYARLLREMAAELLAMEGTG